MKFLCILIICLPFFSYVHILPLSYQPIKVYRIDMDHMDQRVCCVILTKISLRATFLEMTAFAEFEEMKIKFHPEL